MKRIITSLSFIVFVCSQLSAQSKIADAFTAIPSVNLPYYGTKTDQRQYPQRSYGFNFTLWGNSLNVNLWSDLGLTVPLANGAESSPFCTIYRRFIPTNGSYFLGAIDIVPGDNWKKMLVTANSTGAYEDGTLEELNEILRNMLRKQCGKKSSPSVGLLHE